MSISIIKCCPFCGIPSHVEDGEHEANSKTLFEPNPHVLSNGNVFQVFCIMCGARGPESETEDEAVSEWNNAKWAQWLEREAEPRDLTGGAF
jgi:Lar family restriction alleviation protein